MVLKVKRVDRVEIVKLEIKLKLFIILNLCLKVFGIIFLNFFIYSGSWIDEEFVILYRSILIVVGIIIIFLVLGVGI